MFFKEERYDLFLCEIADRYQFLWKDASMWCGFYHFLHIIWMKKGFQLWSSCSQCKETAYQFNSEVVYDCTSLKCLVSGNIAKLCEGHQTQPSHKAHGVYTWCSFLRIKVFWKAIVSFLCMTWGAVTMCVMNKIWVMEKKVENH